MANEANKGSQRAYTSPYKKRVNVYPTQSATGYAPVSSFDPTTARGSLDRIERQSEMFGTGLADGKQVWYGGMTPEQRTEYFKTTPTITGDVKYDPTGGLKSIGGFGRGGSGGMSSADKLAWEKFRADNKLDQSKFGLEQEKWASELAQMELDAEQAAQDRATKQRALGLLRNQLDGGYRSNIDEMLKQINAMGRTAETDIGSAYGSALSNIGGGYKTASDLMGSGYNALDAYLNKYNSNPYAGLQASAAPVTADSMNYLQAYGAPTADVQGQIQAENLASQQGADAFNRLVSVLGGAQEQSNLSRLAESQMARNLGSTQLGSQRAMFEAQAANAQAQALAELRQRIGQQRLEQEGAAGQRKQNIIDQLIAAGVDPYSAYSPQTASRPSAPAVVPPALANLIPPAAPAQNGLSRELLDELAARRFRY